MLSITAEYAVRTLTWLAANHPVDWVLTRDLAQGAEVPEAYLSKILTALTHGGLLEARRGPGGGYRLARPPREILLQEITGVVDRSGELPACLLDRRRPCTDEEPCTAHPGWRKVRLAYQEFLSTASLEDICGSS